MSQTSAADESNTVIIGLMGQFGYGNLGDASTQDAMIQHVRRRIPNARFRGFSLNPEDTVNRHGIDSFAISRQSWKTENMSAAGRRYAAFASWIGRQPIPRAKDIGRLLARVPIEGGLIADAYRSLKGVRLFIICGGGQIEDYWCGGGGPWAYPYTLLKWALLARLTGARVAVVSVGGGPINHRLSAMFLRWALKLAHYRTYRDVFTHDLVRGIGVTTDDGVFPDLTYSLELDVPRASVPTKVGSGRRIAIGPIGFMKTGLWPREDDDAYNVYATKLVEFISFLLDRGNTIVFIPGEAYYDQLVIDDLLERMKTARSALDRVERPSIDTVPELLAQLSAVDIVVPSRFHTVVMSHMLTKPTIALSYQEKIDFLMEEAELGAYCLQVSNFDVATLKERIVAIEADAKAIRARLQRRNDEHRSKLALQYEKVFALLGPQAAAGTEPALPLASSPE